MHDQTSFGVSPLDQDSSARRRVFHRCLLLAFASGIAALGGHTALYGLEDVSETLRDRSIVAVLIGMAWMAVAYLVARRGRLATASAMLVALAVVGLGVAVFWMTSYSLLLLPLVAVPVTLSVLLLDESGVLLGAVLSVLAVATGLLLPYRDALAAQGVAAVPAPPLMAIALCAVAAGSVAILTRPLRRRADGMLHQLEAQFTKLHHVEHARQDALQAVGAANEDVARQQHYLAALVRQIGQGAVRVDPSGVISAANSIANDMWRTVSSEPLAGQQLDAVRNLLAQDDQRQRHADLVALDAALPDAYTHLLLDRREGLHYNRLRNELMGLLTDEMRTPLTSVVTALDLTIGQQHLPDEADRVLIGARRTSQRLLELVSILLEMNQIEQHPGTLRFAPMPLCRVLETGVAHLAPVAQQGAVTVALSFASDGTVHLDHDRFLRAFIYVLDQALRRSPPYSTVTVNVDRNHNTMDVQVVDQGAPSLVHGSDGRSTPRANGDRSGLALGMAFSSMVVEAHGGTLVTRADGDQGNVYEITLPAEVVASSQSQPLRLPEPSEPRR